MAIDTENKRRSVQGYSIGIMPVPDGTIDASDRATLAWLYAGFVYGTPPSPGIAAYLHTRFHLHHNIRRFN